MYKILTSKVANILIKALRVFSTLNKIFVVSTTISNVFKVIATILQSNSKLVILALFLSYYFPIIEKSLNLFNILSYFFIILVFCKKLNIY